MKANIVSLLLLCATAAHAQVYPHTDPGNTSGWILNDSMSDEFDGASIDTAKWEPLSWTGRKPAQHVFENVAVSGGKAILTTDWKSGPTSITEGAYTIDTGYFQSIAFQRYGYFEIRMRALDFPLVTGWWLTGGSKTYSREIDMYESGSGVPGREYIWGNNYHIWQTPTANGVDSTHSQANPPHITLPFKAIDDYHTYGFEWDKDSMTLYVDGDQKYTRPTESFRVGQRLMVGNEYNQWITSLEAMSNNVHKLPATYDIEYVRAWYKPDTDVRWHVDGTNGDDANDGLSWSNAKKTIGAAVNEAFNGDEIWVAQGVYREYLTFFGLRNMNVYGGFRPGDTSLDDRNPDLYPTLVVACVDNREVCSVCDVHGFRLDGFTFSGTEGNYETGLRVTGPSTDLIIANCRTSWNQPVNGAAAGSSAVGHGLTEVRYENCVFANNKCFGAYAGSAGLSVSKGAQVDLVNCRFLENETSGAGGALGVSWTDAATSVSMTNCIVANNINQTGEAAVYLNSGSLTMVNCTVAGNSGHGVEIDSVSSAIQPADLRNNIFFDNVQYGVVERKQISSFYNNIFYANANQLYWGSAKNSESAINGISGSSGNLVRDPMLVNLANNNARLQSGSQAINAAQASSAPDYDADGVWRSTPDIGAYEFTGTAVAQRPAGGINMQIPGRVDAAAYDEGGQGVAFNDTTALNQAQFYRGHGPETEWKVPEGSPDIGWTEAGEWLEYTVDVAPGTYDMYVRLSSDNTDRQIRFLLDGTELATVTCPNTGSWDVFTNVNVGSVTLAGGSNLVLRAEMLDGGMNYSWVEFYPTPILASQDIGSPSPAGSMHYDNGRYFVKGNGSDLWDSATDHFHYVNQTLSGDGFIHARVNEIVAPNDMAKSGVMLRDSLDDDAPYVLLLQHPNNQVALTWRETAGALPRTAGWYVGDSNDVKRLALARHGDQFRAYYSVDGAAWILAGEPVTVFMGEAVQCGLGVNSASPGALSSSIFTEVGIDTDPSLMVPPETDSDGDGIPDDWEADMGTLALSDDAGVDYDDDGPDTGDEYIADTDPLDGGSYLFAEGSPIPGNSYSVSFLSSSNRVYSVESTENLLSDWTEWTNGIPGSGSWLEIIDTDAATNRFYRVKVSL